MILNRDKKIKPEKLITQKNQQDTNARKDKNIEKEKKLLKQNSLRE
jgi:hypothetical protein